MASSTEPGERNREPRRRKGSAAIAAIDQLAPALAIIAAAWYAVLTFSYDQFYRRLTVSLSDVGLGYASILANSVGTAFAVVVIAAVLSVPVIVGMVLVWLLRGREVSWRTTRPYIRRWLVSLGIACFLIAIFVLPAVSSTRYARVKEGKAVLPPRLPVADFTLLPIHADPVTLEPAAKDSAPSIMAMAKGSFLYLGQANGAVVLYDSNRQQVIYVPASDVVLRVTNCHVQSESVKEVCAGAKSVIWPFA